MQSLISNTICFGLDQQRDRRSFSIFLQLLGNHQTAETLSGRLSIIEIETCFDSLFTLLKNHLSVDEYHQFFLDAPHATSQIPMQAEE